MWSRTEPRTTFRLYDVPVGWVVSGIGSRLIDWVGPTRQGRTKGTVALLRVLKRAPIP